VILDPGLAGGVFGALIGAIAGVVCLLCLRRHRMELEQAREEFQIMLRQQQTEYLDGIAQVGKAVGFLEESAQNTEEAVKGRLTGSVRSQAMQLLRSGMKPETAAAKLGIGRREMSLISTVSRILSS
jgi:hypothetical protein